MSYEPIWAERARETRQALARFDFGRPCNEAEAALYTLARYASESIQANFPDVSRELLGWVFLDASAGLRQIVTLAPDMPAQRIPLLLMVIGKALLEGVPAP